MSDKKFLEHLTEALTSIINKGAFKVKNKLNISNFAYIILIEGLKEATIIKTSINDNHMFIDKEAREIRDYEIDNSTLILIFKQKVLEKSPQSDLNLMNEIIKGNVRFIGNVLLVMYLFEEHDSIT